MITVMGASGNTGQKIVEALRGNGQQVRALGRSSDTLAELRRTGAETIAGDTRDSAFLTAAFRGADAVYTLLPTDRQAPDYPGRQSLEGDSIVTAIRASGVQNVVALSSLGAELSDRTGVIAGLHEQEERLKRIEDVNLCILRPVSFFENFFDQLDVIRHEGIVADSVEPDLAIPMIASQDVATAAATALMVRDWSGVAVRELLGQRELSYREAARIIGQRIGQPDLDYVQLPYADMIDALVQAGLSASFASRYVEMTRAFNERIVQPRDGRTPANTTPTRFEDFADELALVHRANQAA